MNRRYSRAALILSAIISLTNFAPAQTSPQSPDDAPYSVWAPAEGLRVFSGPGDEYYATAELSAGAECQVYEQRPDGWLAIRPPEGSYSLVSASAIERMEGGVGRVVRESVSSRVGSQLAQQHDAVQVRLEQGELVQLIDNVGQAPTNWQKIAPPAGEFRWVRGEDVSLKPVAPAMENFAVEPTSDGEWRERPEDGEATVKVVAHNEPAAADAPISSPSPLAPEVGRENTLPAENLSFDTRLDLLEIQLSRRVAGPPNLWVFDDLERGAAQLLGVAATAEQNAHVSHFAERLQRFSQIAARFRTVGLNRSPAPESAAAADRLLSVNDRPPTGYDAVGVLRPVVSKRGNAPPYALVDKRGEVVTFLTPSPSLNLQSYLGERIGVSGTRSYLPEYQKRNIQTARVAPVDGAVRR